MRAVIVYESMYGSTHAVADAIGRGLAGAAEQVIVVGVGESDPDVLAGADLLVVGGPTHVHGMTSKRTREAAVQSAADDDELHLEPHADGPGLRDWFDGLEDGADRMSAAFDTRIDKPAVLTGRASKAIARRLHRHGYRMAADPTSFLVDTHGRLLDGQEAAATEWGRELAKAVSSVA